MTLPDALRRVERRLVLRALRAAGGSPRDAAPLLGICERAVYDRIERHGLGAELDALRAAAGWSPTAKARAARHV